MRLSVIFSLVNVKRAAHLADWDLKQRRESLQLPGLPSCMSCLDSETRLGGVFGVQLEQLISKRQHPLHHQSMAKAEAVSPPGAALTAVTLSPA